MRRLHDGESRQLPTVIALKPSLGDQPPWAYALTQLQRWVITLGGCLERFQTIIEGHLESESPLASTIAI